MSKAKEIWDKGIGSVHGADVTQRLCYETASNLSAYARELEKEQSDLDWLECEIEEDLAYWTKNHDQKHEFTKGIKASHKDILHLIKKRKEAKS